MPMRSGLEEFSTGAESETEVLRKMAIARKRLVPLSRGRGLRNASCSIANRSHPSSVQVFDEENVLVFT